MSLVRPVMMLYVFFAIHEVYEEVSKQRRTTDCICARMLRIRALPTFRTKSIEKPSITINHLQTALFNFFLGGGGKTSFISVYVRR